MLNPFRFSNLSECVQEQHTTTTKTKTTPAEASNHKHPEKTTNRIREPENLRNTNAWDFCVLCGSVSVCVCGELALGG